MKRFSIFFAAVLALAVGGQVVYGQGQVVSFFVPTSDAGVVVPIGAMPEGLVVKDIVCESGSATINLMQDAGEGFVDIGQFWIDGTTTWSYHFGAGIVVDPGATLGIKSSNAPRWVTIGGYVPSSSGAVPAVGELGMFVMAAVFLVVGAVVFTRMKQRQVA